MVERMMLLNRLCKRKFEYYDVVVKGNEGMNWECPEKRDRVA